MDGVTILTTYEKGLLTGYGCLGIIFTFVCIFALSVMLADETTAGFKGFFAGVCILVSVFGSIGTIVATIDAKHTEYKIAVDDTVTLNELTSRYEIISQDGKLFTVMELKTENEKD